MNDDVAVQAICTIHLEKVRKTAVLNFVFGTKQYIYYHQTSNIIRPKYQNFNVSRLFLQLLWSNPLKPRVKSRMM